VWVLIAIGIVIAIAAAIFGVYKRRIAMQRRQNQVIVVNNEKRSS